ncbi:hypothetical protein KDD17_11515 [Sulfitobacter albidus]|uniref:Uncharacterized protein n=1 Tax=Sulfitobacter albidus TaxID=2829501 RepID=A0A975JBV0_9RHOB|nr:hypothetical protein [Sulfitobacter albidus]QUJ75586.1 hypothetical protein KDD17_11515 [Sulfitobacter albidus]
MGDEIKTSAEAMEQAAGPRMHEVHTDDTTPNTRDQALPKKVKSQPVDQKSPAQWAYERTVVYLKKFEESLDDQHEVAMGFVGADAGVLRIEGMGYFDPDIVTFYGADPTGAKMQLVQHVSQLSVVFRALPKAVEQKAPNRIGFKLAQDLDTA